ncbi:MAG: alpha/beta hydrolase [Telmatospirillum sp.]|nr:alpha/beta hydrolase [Telmatospirillum sp.]
MKLEILHCPPPDGAGTHTPLLFVHGSYCAAWIWAERFMPWFAARGYPCHAVSLRGHGRSGGSLSDASLADYVEDVASAAAGLDAPPVVIGHSMGGLVVQHHLMRHPAMGGILLASLPPSGLSASALHMSMFSPDVLFQLGLLQSVGPSMVSPSVVHRAFFSAGTPPEAVARLLPRLQEESPRVTLDLLCPPEPRAVPGRARPPLLVVGGDADLFLPVSAFTDTADHYGGDLNILPGAPHGLMLDDVWWRPTAEIMLSWLDRQGL